VRSKNRNLFIRSLWAEKVYPTSIIVTKAAFGLFLISSIVIAATAMVAVVVAGASGGKSDSDSDRNKSRSSSSYRSSSFSPLSTVVDITYDLARARYIFTTHKFSRES